MCRVDEQLALGDYRPTSTTTFATYVAVRIDTWPLKDQPAPATAESCA